MNFNEPVEMPSENEMNRSIDLILDRGLPQKEAVKWNLLPLRDVIFGVEDCVLISFLVYFGVMAAFSILSVKGAPVLPLQFLSAPLLFGELLLLSLWKDRMNGTLEWKQVCRINYPRLTVCRMALFGALSVVTNVAGNLLFWQLTGRQISFLWILSFSFASLFLFSFFSLAMLRRNLRYGTLIPTLVWIVAGVLMYMAGDLTKLTRILPLYALLVICVSALVMICLQIRSYLMTPAYAFRES